MRVRSPVGKRGGCLSIGENLFERPPGVFETSFDSASLASTYI